MYSVLQKANLLEPGHSIFLLLVPLFEACFSFAKKALKHTDYCIFNEFFPCCAARLLVSVYRRVYIRKQLSGYNHRLSGQSVYYIIVSLGFAGFSHHFSKQARKFTVSSV